MEIPIIDVEQVQGFLLCLARVGAMLATMPVFSGGQVPIRIRTGLAILVSLLIFPLVRQHLPQVQFEVLELFLLLLKESLLGLMTGFLAQLIFMAAEFGGSLIGYQMGFAAANVFDPATQRQVPLISQFQSVLAIFLFLALDIHHLFFRAILSSFERLPPGTLHFNGDAIQMLMAMANHAFVLGIQLGAPILALLILSNFTLGIMARVFPQLNVFMLAFPINIGVSFLVMGLTMGVVSGLLQQEFLALADRFLHLFSLL